MWSDVDRGGVAGQGLLGRAGSGMGMLCDVGSEDRRIYICEGRCCELCHRVCACETRS
jgi:hypothetical protein